MKHFGDITKLKGSELPLVDIITGGSPCQDLSVAGGRAGLDGERSGLFMEQIRIVKEMRNECIRQLSMRRSDEHIRPRYMVWENVPGAFSSNKGKDFQAVLTEIVRIVDPDAPDVPLPKNGKWSKSGCLMGIGEDGQPFSVAYRLHDAQFWGVPQRRKRIALVADFRGTSAPEILFERKGLPRDIEPGEESGKGTPEDVGRGADKAVSFQERAGRPGGGKGILIQTERTGALATHPQAVCFGNGQLHDAMSPSEDVAKTLNCLSDPMKVVTYGLDRASFNQGKNAQFDFSVEEEKAPTLVSKGPGGVYAKQ